MNHNEEIHHTNTFSNNIEHLNPTNVNQTSTKSSSQEEFSHGEDACDGATSTQSTNQLLSQLQDESTNTIQPYAIPTHPMMTRRKHGIFKPKVFLINYTQHEPCDAKQTLKPPHWRRAMEE